jgi:hypothetical protein
VATDPQGLERLRQLGIRGVPVLFKGDEYVRADLRQVDALLGLAPMEGETLPPGELIDRLTRLLLTAVRLGQRIPRDHWNDATPRAGRTVLGLVHHIVRHGELFAQLATDPDAELSEDLARTLGEPPDPDLEMDVLVERAVATVADIRAWWDEDAADLTRIVNTHLGPESLDQILDSTSYSVAQHTRQLVSLLDDYGLNPDRALEEELRGIALPAAVWDD